MVRSGPSFCLVSMGTPIGLLSPARPAGRISFKPVLLRPLQQGCGGELGNIDHGRAGLSAHHHKGPRQVIAQPDHSSGLLCALQILPGLIGPAGVVQVEYSKDLTVGHHHRLAQVQIHSSRLLSIHCPHSPRLMWKKPGHGPSSTLGLQIRRHSRQPSQQPSRRAVPGTPGKIRSCVTGETVSDSHRLHRPTPTRTVRTTPRTGGRARQIRRRGRRQHRYSSTSPSSRGSRKNIPITMGIKTPFDGASRPASPRR